MIYITRPEIVSAVQWDGTEQGMNRIVDHVYGLNRIRNLRYAEPYESKIQDKVDYSSPAKLFYDLVDGETFYGTFLMVKGDWMVIDIENKSAISINEKAFAEKFREMEKEGIDDIHVIALNQHVHVTLKVQAYTFNPDQVVESI